MGVTCCCYSGDIGCCSFIFGEDYYQGNKIFKKINIKLDTENNNLDDNEKQKFNEYLTKIENNQKEIAQEFKTFLYDTGACVLTQPTVERGLITYLIFLLTQIIKCAKDVNSKFDIEDFSLSNLISSEYPFINLNTDFLAKLKNKYNFDFDKNDFLVKGKNSIINFISTTKKALEIFNELLKSIKDFKKETLNLNLIDKMQTLLDSLGFLCTFISEVFSGITNVQSQLINPRKYKLFFKIANEAAEKNITDPKEIALFYSKGENCGKIEKWEDNMTYKKIEINKY